MDCRYVDVQHLRSSFLLAMPRLLARQLINYCFRAAAAATTTLRTFGVLFAQRRVEKRWAARLVRNYDTDSIRKR